MSHRASPTLIIVCALLMGSPSIKAALAGALTIDALCMRLALAVIFSYVGVRGVTAIIMGYASSRWTPPAERVERGSDSDMRA